MTDKEKDWYIIDNVDMIDSPSLLLYRERVIHNIELMIATAGDANRLAPHVKTNKMQEVGQLMIDRGISHFKTSTIAEAEMMAMAGASQITIAHQLIGPKINRLMSLIQAYPQSQFSIILDDLQIAQKTAALAQQAKVVITCYVDVNSGMDRSGFPISSELLQFYKSIHQLDGLKLAGLHVYDGHYRDPDFQQRKQDITDSFEQVEDIAGQISTAGMTTPQIIAGGSPAFSTHSMNKHVKASPGTSVFWDWNYSQMCPEQAFLPAALVLSRIISKPAPGIITIDLGHKAISAENPIDKRVKFLNIGDHTLISQSEEHGVIKVPDCSIFTVGQELYGLPYHICPTVNAHQEANVIEQEICKEKWRVIARDRRINI